jgi:hypothetical protein
MPITPILMYDVLRASYQFHCPAAPDGALRSVPLSRFRSIDRLGGAAHPAVFRVTYRCGCGDEHVGLVAHDELDYRPIGASELEFRNLLTGRTEKLGSELLELARLQVQRGNWPWRLYCCREATMKPVFPSCFTHLCPAESDLLGVAMRCPGCGEVSLNVVTQRHLDVPFHHDIVRAIERPFGDRRDLTAERFHEELWSAGFDSERLGL